MAQLRRDGVAVPLVAMLIALVSTSDTAAQPAYDQAKLQAYVAAWTSVDRLTAQMQQRISQTDDRAQEAALAREVNALIEATIAVTPGITIAEYQEIAKAAQSDPKLVQRIRNIAE